MRHSINSLLMAVLLAAMVSCSKDLIISEDPENPNEFEAIQLRLTGNIACMTPETRVDKDGFTNDDKIGVYVSEDDLKGDDNKADNVMHTYNSNTNEIVASDGSEIYWGNETNLNIYAYYPYDKNIESSLSFVFSVRGDQSENAEYYKSDFLRAASENVAKTTNTVELNFYHLMSKLSITIVPDNTFTTEEFNNISKALTIDNLPYTGSINLFTGSVSGKDDKSKTITANAGENNTFSAIIFPRAASNIKFRLMLGEKYYSTSLSSANYVSGTEYKYVFTITKSSGGLSLKSASIENWVDGGTYSSSMQAE